MSLRCHTAPCQLDVHQTNLMQSPRCFAQLTHLAFHGNAMQAGFGSGSASGIAGSGANGLSNTNGIIISGVSGAASTQAINSAGNAAATFVTQGLPSFSSVNTAATSGR
jgi:hypothetical protein